MFKELETKLMKNYVYEMDWRYKAVLQSSFTSSEDACFSLLLTK